MSWRQPDVVVSERHARSKTPVLGRARGLVSPRLNSGAERQQQGGLAGGKKHRDKLGGAEKREMITSDPKTMGRAEILMGK